MDEWAEEVVPPCVGDVLANRFRLTKLIGDGGYGSVFLATDITLQKEVAVKTEKPRRRRKPLLRLEALIMRLLTKKATLTGSTPTSPEMYKAGLAPAPYLAMELLGQDVSKIRKATRHGRFSAAWAMTVGRGMFAAIHALHNIGFIHRDIKPSNFTMGLGPEGRLRVYLLDFGLSRQYRLVDGTHRPARASVGFRGTRTYASLNALRRKDQSRGDDLTSFLYVLFELLRGPLPWRKFSEPVEILTCKRLYPTASLLQGLAIELHQLHTMIHTLSYTDTPNYEMMEKLLDLTNGAAKRPTPEDARKSSSVFLFPTPPPTPT